MYCTKCKFTSFDHISSCPKCGSNWSAQRDALNLSWIAGPGHEWIKSEPTGSGAPVDSAPEPMSEANFDLESAAPKQQEEDSTLQELSFDDFEEVSLGDADESEGTTTAPPRTGQPEVPEVDFAEDLDDTVLGADLGDLDDLDLELDDLRETSADHSENGMDDTEISLDDFELELEDVSEKKNSKS